VKYGILSHKLEGMSDMMGRQEREQDHLFVVGSLRDLVPEDHILRQVDRVLDLSWLRSEVADCYAETQGRPGIDPEAALRLMLAGFFHGIVHDRRLMREAQVNLAFRWFAGYRLDEALPDHSTLTRIRQRWGEKCFERIFERTVKACVDAGLVNGETLHVDATLIRANADIESFVRTQVDRQWKENKPDDGSPDDDPPSSDGPRSRTDPEATLAKGGRSQHSEPRYKQHTAVDGKKQIIVDVAVTTGVVREGKGLLDQLARVERRLARHVGTVTADATYGTAHNYAALEQRGTEAVIPPIPVRRSPEGSGLPLSQFQYEEETHSLKCPAGLPMKTTHRDGNQTIFKATSNNCNVCPLRGACLTMGRQTANLPRYVKITDGYGALLRARTRHRERRARDRLRLAQHRWQVEGVHGEAKEQHGLRRAVRRGRKELAIQAYLTAAVMNLKRLAKAQNPGTEQGHPPVCPVSRYSGFLSVAA